MNYYAVARSASRQIAGHPGLEYLRGQIRLRQKILDVGCGEGTRLDTLLPADMSGYGIDISPQAIALAKKQYPRHRFRVGSAEKLPYRNNLFDLVYSAFAIEHCADPEKFIREMVRVAKPGGRLVILAPNYGAPNRRSPVSRTNPAVKLFRGLISDFRPKADLDWDRVIPRPEYRGLDDDTTREPYLPSLSRFLSKLSLRVDRRSSLWELEPLPKKPHQFIFLTLGRLGLPPFVYWGPQVFVSAVK